MKLPSEHAWLLAEQHLLGKPSGSKFEKVARDPKTGKKDPQKKLAENSFVIINDVIYALGEVIGEGGASIVKKGMSKDGTIIAIKIEDSPLKNEKSDSFLAGIKNKLILGQGLRTSPHMKIKLPIAKRVFHTQQKLYTAMQWRGDSSLIQLLEKADILTPTQKQMLCLRSCLLVNQLAEQGIIHADIKAENITAKIDGHDIQLKMIDLGYAKLLKDDKNYIIAEKASGSLGFVCKEVVVNNRYSLLSDSFALGVMMVFQLDIFSKGIPYKEYAAYISAVRKKMITTFDPMKWFEANVKHAVDPALKAILKCMLEPDYQKREGTNDIIIYLCNKLESDPALEEIYKKEMRLIRATTQLKKNNATTAVQIASTPLLTFSDLSPVDESKAAINDSQTPSITGIKRKNSN